MARGGAAGQGSTYGKVPGLISKSSNTAISCDMCGKRIDKRNPDSATPLRSRYCSNACRQRSYRQRQKAGGMGTEAVGGPLTQLSSFVGRTDEMVELGRLLHGVRMLTLTGPAGVGKTRLALELARQEQRSRHCEVIVVKLARLTHIDQIRRQILIAIGELAEDGAPRAPQAAPYANERERLLVLDDCEHVLDECGLMLSELLPRDPYLRVVATSREPLGLPGEAMFSLSGLALPDVDGGSFLSECLRSDAVLLFLDRARTVVPDFQLTQENARHVGEICTRLDGLPLPIEMAARLIRAFPLAEISARLDDRLSLLTNGWRLADQRHQSLRASLQWGYDLLSPAEGSLLRRLSVLPGGFGLDTAAAVAADGDAAKPGTSELLIALSVKSVITPHTDQDGPARFRLLESMRSFGHERLVAESEDTEAYGRLVTWLTQLSEPLHRETFPQPATFRRLREEHGNLTHALHWLIPGADERQLLLAGALATVELSQRPADDTLTLLTHVLDHSVECSPYRSVALEGAAALAGRQADYDTAMRHAEQAVELERGYDRDPLLSRLLLLRSALHEIHDDQGSAVADLRECLKIGHRLRDETLTALCLVGLARYHLLSGELSRAEQVIEKALPLLRSRLSPRWLHTVLVTAGALALEKDDLPSAEAYFIESLRSPAEHTAGPTDALQGLAIVAAHAHRFERVLQLIGAAERIGPRASWGEAWWRKRVNAARSAALKALPANRASASLEAGRAMRHRHVLAFALGSQATSATAEDADSLLSKRERDVTALVVEGLTNRQIAARMHVSVRTVETHIRHIRTTLGLRSRAHIAAWAAARRTATVRPAVLSPPDRGPLAEGGPLVWVSTTGADRSSRSRELRGVRGSG
ncbi:MULTISPECIES: ATP-binding protein [Streptomyces violaceusniger group]|uniref:LuxR C-terminal-related transcriptional regulator n=2 Tax=Streptomyces violaceusniger group TaxID=2839105 RepID=A0ABD5J750_9ACTN|nr:LuxR C-terminal-related transcriptional regulator [Streptomyces violaceusniger]MEE4583094.1 LuxR C-terminal-related transcriptional regulator [Streptomyces sp. DSM 41602]